MKEWNINKSTINDCKEIAEFITIVWNESYKGIVNDKFLSSLKESERQRYLEAKKNFDEKNNLPLYLLKEYQNKGIGRMLLEKAFEEARKMGYKKMKIGCLEKNPSNGFYLKMGGKIIGKRKFVLPNEILHENVYEYQL